MTDHRSSAPDFTLNGITWQCWVINGGSFEWRSTCGRYAAWRDGKVYRARRGERAGQIEYSSLKEAMTAAGGTRRQAA